MFRLQFAGCPSWQSKISTKDHSARRQPITRTKLAYEVAKNVGKFLEREKVKGHGDHSRCNLEDALLSNMYLTRLVQVSIASWQPEIFMG
ncbi:hypothetical protein BDM02DRAFT_2540630 [Thelephora ganbajun]|uniref:Uncharacterized protein n=1 Tax=Thelephora ganbajun TaxID=370292 RepID=A0ACB6YY14_THEGA|nr:hypothetical protein BDM02DRAFT_2540630 [Thelephora ganbajun]